MQDLLPLLLFKLLKLLVNCMTGANADALE